MKLIQKSKALYIYHSEQKPEERITRKIHTLIEKCTTHELVHELNITFIFPRNTTFDRFKFFQSMQQPHESLETFYSRIREAGAICKLKDLEEDLV